MMLGEMIKIFFTVQLINMWVEKELKSWMLSKDRQLLEQFSVQKEFDRSFFNGKQFEEIFTRLNLVALRLLAIQEDNGWKSTSMDLSWLTEAWTRLQKPFARQQVGF